MQSRSLNWMLTVNNPDCSLDDFFDHLKANDAKYARAQLEVGDSGTHHFQACVGYKALVRFKRMTLLFPETHIEPAKNALKSWNYCGKEDTRVEGPLEFGLPPAAKNVKGDTKKRNAMIIEYGVVKACEDGLIPLEKFK